jgi:hypothetical protein
MQKEVGTHEYARTILLVFAASLIFFMQAGFAMVRLIQMRKIIRWMTRQCVLDVCHGTIEVLTRQQSVSHASICTGN